MVFVRRTEYHSALVERVARRVEGHGISRSAIDDAVSRVLTALDQGSPDATPAGPEGSATLVAALTARAVPDLASRVRDTLGREGVSITDLGLASSGQHTVVTVRVPGAARAALERVAGREGWSLVISDAPVGTQHG